MSHLHAITGLAGFTLRRIAAGKRWYTAGLILAAAPILAFIAAPRARAPAAEIADGIAMLLSAHLAPLLLALIYGNALTTSEIEDGTAGYTLLAGLPRGVAAVVQVVVTWLGLAALCALGIAATYAATAYAAKAGGPRPDPERAAMLAVGAAAALLPWLATVAFCGYAFRKGIAVSVALAVIVEIMVPYMPIRWAAWTLTNNSRAIMSASFGAAERAEYLDYAQGWVFPTPGEAASYLAVVAALALVLCVVAASNRNLVRTEAA